MLAVEHAGNCVQNCRCIDALTAITGNYDTPAGMRGPTTYTFDGELVGGMPDVMGGGPQSKLPQIGSEKFPLYSTYAPQWSDAETLMEAAHTGKPYPIVEGFCMSGDFISMGNSLYNWEALMSSISAVADFRPLQRPERRISCCRCGIGLKSILPERVKARRARRALPAGRSIRRLTANGIQRSPSACSRRRGCPGPRAKATSNGRIGRVFATRCSKARAWSGRSFRRGSRKKDGSTARRTTLTTGVRIAVTKRESSMRESRGSLRQARSTSCGRSLWKAPITTAATTFLRLSIPRKA